MGLFSSEHAQYFEVVVIYGVEGWRGVQKGLLTYVCRYRLCSLRNPVLTNLDKPQLEFGVKSWVRCLSMATTGAGRLYLGMPLPGNFRGLWSMCPTKGRIYSTQCL